MNINSIPMHHKFKTELDKLNESFDLSIDGIHLNSEAGFEILVNFIGFLPPSFNIVIEFKDSHISASRKTLEDEISLEFTPFLAKYAEFAEAFNAFIRANKDREEITRLETVFDVLEKMYHSIEIHVPSILDKFLGALGDNQKQYLGEKHVLNYYRKSIEEENVQDVCHDFREILNDICWMEDDYWILLQLHEGQAPYQREFIDAQTLFTAIMKFARHACDVSELSLDQVTLIPLAELQKKNARVEFKTIQLNHNTIGDCAYLVKKGLYGINGLEAIEDYLLEHEEVDTFRFPLSIHESQISFIEKVVADHRWADLKITDTNKARRLMKAWQMMDEGKDLSSPDIQETLYS